ncbi:MAG: hypothetical protein U7127_00925 [Phormidium sp.]
MIATIRGMVEIEQVEIDRKWQEDENRRDRQLQETLATQEAAERERDRLALEQTKNQEQREKKRDRYLQNIIFFFGTAIGAGGIFASSYPLSKDIAIKWLPNLSLPVHPFVWSILWSIIFGLAFGSLVLGILMLLRKLSPKD